MSCSTYYSQQCVVSVCSVPLYLSAVVHSPPPSWKAELEWFHPLQRLWNQYMYGGRGCFFCLHVFFRAVHVLARSLKMRRTNSDICHMDIRHTVGARPPAGGWPQVSSGGAPRACAPRSVTCRHIAGEIPARGQCMWQMRCAVGLESLAILPAGAANSPLLCFFKPKTSSNVGQCSK